MASQALRRRRETTTFYCLVSAKATASE